MWSPICSAVAEEVRPTPFSHTTRFPLVGAHRTLPCLTCHVNNNYHLNGTACITCHQADYTSANNPPHLTYGFPTDCTLCHGSTAVNWTTATFSHTNLFPLVGAHATRPCLTCHVNNNYHLNSVACISCHQADYTGANNPPHLAYGFPTDCTVCHGSTAVNWTSATFSHTTSFPLAGVHATLACSTCHVNNNYRLHSAGCITCHQADYTGTTNPPHVADGLSTDCTLCHGNAAVNWTSATRLR